jgi:hypothetical protein
VGFPAPDLATVTGFDARGPASAFAAGFAIRAGGLAAGFGRAASGSPMISPLPTWSKAENVNFMASSA